MDYLLNIIMLNGYIGGEYIDGAHWYLTYLILFNVIIAVIAWIEKKYKIDKINLFILWMVANFTTKVLSLYLSPFSLLHNLLGGQYMIFLMMGIALKELLKDKEEIMHKRKYIFLFVFSQIMCLFTQNVIVFIGIEIFLFIFVHAIKEKITILDNKLINGIGNISYITYLLHQNIGYQMLFGMIFVFHQYMLMYTLVVTCIMLGISAFMYKYYEVPIQKRMSEIMKEKFKNSQKGNLSGRTS